MKILLSVTPHEFKHHFSEVMDMCTDMCMAANQEIIITIPKKKNGQTHIEIAKIIPVDGGIKYGYNHELLKKFGINTDNQMNRIENVIADKLQSAMIIAAKELVKTFGL